jgi:hypothetical protein
MGACCSQPGQELPAATEADIKRLREKGHLPCLAGPSIDFEGDNQCTTVYIAEYENGAEITFLFLDEDRPNRCEDCIYDNIRRPLFGRKSDIESVVIVNDTVQFPGTHSGEQTWNAKVPGHGEKVVELSDFEKKDDTDPIIWINVWNHLCKCLYLLVLVICNLYFPLSHARVFLVLVVLIFVSFLLRGKWAKRITIPIWKSHIRDPGQVGLRKARRVVTSWYELAAAPKWMLDSKG